MPAGAEHCLAPAMAQPGRPASWDRDRNGQRTMNEQLVTGTTLPAPAGRSNKEIGAVLSFSEKTIRNYISRISRSSK